MTTRRLYLILACALSLAVAGRAQVSYTGGTYTQNFNTLPASGNTNSFPLAGNGPFALDGAPVNAFGLAGWSFVKYAGTGANAIFLVSTGTSTTGGVYSFGATASPDRALGSLGSGGVASRFGVAFTNNSGVTVTQFTLSYTGEEWRRGSSAANKLTFAYGLGATDLNNGTFIAVPSLDFTAPNTSGSSVATDGNAAGNRTVISAIVTGLTWAPGQTLVLRWTDVDDPGSDDGLAVDDLTFSTAASLIPTVTATVPANGAVNLLGSTNLTISFNTPVVASGTWFSIVGSVSGAHTATVLGGPTDYTLVPSPAFADGETVTVTVLAAQVVDAATGTIHPAEDYPFSFTILSTTPLPIHAIQGSGTASPYTGQVVTVQGVVTASFQGTNGLGGFYVQAPEAAYDGDPATSEGMFVFNNSYTVAPGDVVKVTGTVAEFGTAPTTETELTNVINFLKLGTATLPAPVAVTLPFASTTDAERYEGMRVTLPQTLTVTDNFDFGHYGEFILANGRLSTPTNVVAPGVPAQTLEVANFLNQILVDDDSSATYPDPTPYLYNSAGRGLTFRAGSTVTGLAGILDEKFGAYIVEPTETPVFTDANPRVDSPAVIGTLRVCIGNVANLMNGDGAGGGFPTSRGATTAAEYQRQLAKVTAALLNLAPDIMGLTEVENDRVTNGLPNSYGPTSAIAQLVASLNAGAPPGTSYAFVDASAVDITTDQIHVALIYRTETVETVGLPAMLSDASFNNVARNPLAQTFRQKSSGEKLTVCINHFRAKGSVAAGAGNTDSGDGQGTNNALRVQEATALTAWLATDPTGSGDPDFLIIGDLNAYAKEDPITAIKAASYVNLTETFEGEGGYSYAFNGEFGHIDHALANPHLAEQVVGAATWHVNADEPVYYDYNLENKSAAQQTINADTIFRYSDHDPVVIGVSLHPEYAAPVFTTQPVSQTVTVGESVTFFAAATGYPAPTFQWQRNGADLGGATSPALTLDHVTTAAAGTYTVVAHNSIGSATSDPATLTVNPAAATVTLGNLNLVYDGTPKPATVTTSPAGLTVNLTYDGSSAAPTNAGSYAVAATVVDANYTGSATGTLTIAKADQTISFDPVPGVTYGATPFTVNATAGSGLAVTFSIVSGPATISGTTVTITGAGAVVVRASQAGDANHNPAPDVDQPLTVGKANQTIAFNPIPGATYGDAPFAINATASSGLPVSFAIVSGPATISGTTVTITGAGAVVVRASQAGDANHNPAPDVDQPFTVSKANQTITFAPLADKPYGNAPFTVDATASSGLPVSISVANGPASVSGHTVTLAGAGGVMLRAAQVGDANYNPAPDVDQAFAVAKAALTATAQSATRVYGTANPALTIAYGSFVNGDTAAGLDTPPTAATAATATSDVGAYPITVGGGADHNYAFAYVSGTLTITQAGQLISFGPLANRTFGDAPFSVSATASSNLPVNFSVVSGPATVAGYTVTLTGAGTVVLRASQNGGLNYAAAAPVDQSFSVAKAAATVTLGNLNFIYDGAPKPATATTSPAGLTVNFTYNGGGSAPVNVGSYAVVATIADPNYQGSASGTLVIADGTPPVIRSLVASPAVLWPANHKMVRVVIAADVVDDVDPAPTSRIIAVSSNQPANGTGDGNTSPDWELTGALTLNLRAERSGNDGDRIYTITVESRDYSNNVSTSTVTVTVPHNR
jgi:predicted extracellular nuclease